MVTPAPVVTQVTQTTQTTQTSPNGMVTTTQSLPVNSYIVSQAPPAVQVEVLLAQPSSAHVWIAGYWTWRQNQYEWMAGRWEVPPYSNAKWSPPHWETENGAYRFYEGSWI